MSTKMCRTVVLDDHPTDQDAFGSHKRIAHAILNTILHEEGGKAIALEGSWGSGKSTVIKILQKLIETNGPLSKDIEIFIFDAWAHLGDPLRRSFLERLYNFLKQKGWLKQKTAVEIKRKLEQLTGTMERTVTKPILTTWGALIAVATLFSAMSVAFLSVESKILPTWAQNVRPYLVYILMVLPLFVLIGVVVESGKWLFKYIRLRPNWKFWSSSFWKTNVPNRPKFTFLLVTSSPIQHTHTHRTQNPTSVEFSEEFSDILKQVFENDKGNRERLLVIVIDNLDRLAQRESLEIWSTMKAFFEPGILSNASWLKQFWLIVPYDREGINKLWQEASQHKDLAEAFIEKTFQIRFCVPEPVLADWYQYMADRLKEAFPDHASDELETVRRVYRLYRLSDDRVNRSVTPREVKLFTNQLGVLHRQWNDDIPLPIQAIYVLYRDEITENPCKALTDLEWIPKHILHQFHQEHLREYLGALHFNVEPEKVLHILIADRIEKALIEGDGKVLVEFQNLPGFVEVLDEIIGERSLEWASSNPSLISFSVLSLQQLDALPVSIWRTLSRSCKGVNEWTPFNPKVAQGLLVLVDASEDSEKEALALALIQSVSQTKVFKKGERDEEEIDERIVDDWSAGLITFVQGMHHKGFGRLLKKHFRVPGSSKDYVEVLSRLEDKGMKNLQEIVPYFVPFISSENILQDFESAVEDGQLSEKHAKAIRIILEQKILSDNVFWDSLTDTIKSKIFNAHNLALDFISNLLHILVFLEDYETSVQATNIIEELSLNGRIFHYLYRANKEGNERLKGLSVVLLLEHNPKAKLHQNWYNAQDGWRVFQNIMNSPSSDVIKVLAAIFTMRSKLEPLLELPKTYPNTTNICKAVLEHLVEKESPIITSHIFVEEFSQFKKLLSPESIGRLIPRLCERDALVNVVRKFPFDESKSALYLQILRACKEPSREFFDFLKQGLTSINREIWNSHLEEHGDLIEILIEFPKRRKLNLGTALGDAIEDFIQETIRKIENEEIDEVPYSPEEFQKILKSLNPSSFKTTLRRIRDLLVQHAAGINLTEVLKLLPPGTFYVSGENLLLEDADDIVRRLFKEIIDNVIPGEMKWMLEILKTFPEILSKAKHESVEDLLGRIQRAKNGEELEEEEKKILEEIEKIVKNNLSGGND